MSKTEDIIKKVYFDPAGYSSKKVTLEDAKKENSLDVKLNLEAKAKKTRRYPNISVGDKVKILRKKKNFEKERVGVWGDEKYEVVSIGTSHWASIL